MNKQSPKSMAISIFIYSLISISGPLVVLGVPAYFADKHFGTKPMVFLVAVFTAFIITNVLLFKKVAEVNRTVAAEFPPVKKEEKTEIETAAEDNK